MQTIKPKGLSDGKIEVQSEQNDNDKRLVEWLKARINPRAEEAADNIMDAAGPISQRAQLLSEQCPKNE